jgi:hypothetical protein
MKVALDLLALRAFLLRVGSADDWEPTAELLQLGAILYVPPIVAEELASGVGNIERQWRKAPLHEIQADDFLKGCATGIARRYLDYHPDPRDCRLVAEAECANMDSLVTLSNDLISGLGRRAEKVRIEKPSDAVARYRASGQNSQD